MPQVLIAIVPIVAGAAISAAGLGIAGVILTVAITVATPVAEPRLVREPHP